MTNSLTEIRDYERLSYCQYIKLKKKFKHRISFCTHFSRFFFSALTTFVAPFVALHAGYPIFIGGSYTLLRNKCRSILHYRFLCFLQFRVGALFLFHVTICFVFPFLPSLVLSWQLSVHNFVLLQCLNFFLFLCTYFLSFYFNFLFSCLFYGLLIS